MIAYVQDIAKEIATRLRANPAQAEELQDRFVVLQEELNRLDPREFLPEARFRFVSLRRRARYLAQILQSHWNTNAGREAGSVRHREETACECDAIVEVLRSFGGALSTAPSRSLAFVQNAELRKIVERDYRELTQILFPEGAWKSVVIMAGSILEAILYDLLTRDAARIAAAMASPKAPKKKGGVVKDITQDTHEDEWKLANLIEVAVNLTLLPQAKADTIDQVLREYRNFVHPKKEATLRQELGDAEGMLALGALNGVIDHLQ